MEAIRASLAHAIDAAEPRELAPLVKQLRETLAELDELPTGEERSVVDDLATRRAERRTAAQG